MRTRNEFILADLIAARAEATPELDVLTFEHLSVDGGATPDEVRTFADLYRNANRIAAALVQRGVTPGDRFGLMMRNHPEFVEAMIAASIEAYRATDDAFWLNQARLAFEWFLGRNDLDAPLYDFRTGGCCDGLTPEGPNHNEGAESTLAWLIALLSFLIQVGRQTLDLKQDEEPADWAEEQASNR